MVALYGKEEVEKREKIGASYLELLKDKGYSLPVVKNDRTSVFAQFTVRSEKREEIVEKLHLNGVQVTLQYCIREML